MANRQTKVCVLWAVHCRFDPAPLAGPVAYDEATVATTLAAMISRSMTPNGGA